MLPTRLMHTIALLMACACLPSVESSSWSTLLRGGGRQSSARALQQQAARGLRVRVFYDANHILWDKHQGADTDLTPAVVNNWIVSLDGVDIGQCKDGTGLVYEQAESGGPVLEAGVDVCVRPPFSTINGENSCAAAGIECEQSKWSVNATRFPYRAEIVDNPNYGGVVWYDGPDSAAGTAEPWWKIYVKDFCYTLREMDFVSRDLLDEAWIRFSLAEGPLVNVTSFPTSSPTTVAPSDAPSATPSISVAPSTSTAPSLAPSHAPSVAPSDVPSSAPSTAPSDVPSSAPSDMPSTMPSLAPSDVPSLAPSSAPSLEPSAAPSVAPSTSPSDGPLLTPSRTPTAAPSMEPSDGPSLVPSQTPTSVLAR